MESSCTRFTAAEGGARLAAHSGSKNILVTEHTAFISTSVLIEHAYNIRGHFSSGSQRSIFITRSSRIDCVAHELTILTDLAILKAKLYNDVSDWSEELEYKEVLVCTSEVFKMILEKDILKIPNLNILIIDSCHLIFKDENLQYIMNLYKKYKENERPKILALTYPLFTAPKDEQTDKQKEANNKSITGEIKDCNDKNEDNETSVVNENGNNEINETGNSVENEIGEVLKSDFGVYSNMDDFEMYEKLEWKIEELEKALCCEMDLAEDIDSGKRLSPSTIKPKEVIIEYKPHTSILDLSEHYIELEKYMKDTINDALDFINEHRYDPTEIYGEELYEEFKNIPDPCIDPRQIFKEFLYVLEQLGPYAADKAAFSLLAKLEKLKIKIPYERHFLLLCLCTTVFVKIRCYADLAFSKFDSDWDKIVNFSTPKILRFAEILEQFQPDSHIDAKNNIDNAKNANDHVGNKKVDENDDALIDKIDEVNDNENTTAISDIKTKADIKTKTKQLLNEIENCDFTTLGNKIEDKVNTYQANLKDLDDDTVISDSDKRVGVKNVSDKAVEMKYGKRGHRTRGRRAPRGNVAKMQQLQQNPDSLCGIVFLKEALMAKIMFMLIVDMSRSRPSLSHLCAQYCASEDGVDKDNQKEGKKQEEVLKKFRMHECNLLLATSVLEEGIDLPRCNLVVRWDVPPSYRSHGLCRGRARAPRASVALLTTADTDSRMLVHNLAIYKELDQIITRKCGCGIQFEPPQEEENHADNVAFIVKPYIPLESISNTKTDKEKENINSNSDLEGKIDTNRIIIDVTNVNTIGLSNNDTKDKINDVNTIIEEMKEIHINKENGETEIGEIKESNTFDRKNEISEKNENIDKEKECQKILDFRENDEIKDTNIDNKCKDFKFEYKLNDKKTDDTVASVDLNSAIALINRYCGKLPSDTFTRLAPQWWMEQVQIPDREGVLKIAYICTLRMPLNCPVKYNIVGHPMPTKVLARRMVALQACRILHKSGELDDQLMPIGKENFKAAELENNINLTETTDANDCARPGTTKRRQYYYKRTAWEFTDCQAIIDTTDEEIEKKPTLDEEHSGVKQHTNVLHAVSASLWCALPERYNTRGRRLHAPQHARHAVAVLMAARAPTPRPLRLQIPAFPVYTRSGEVRVSVEPALDADVRLSPRRARLIRRFMRFVFSDVLRVRRRGMKLQTDGSTHNNYYVVPTVKKTRQDGTTWIDIDWPFLELIYKHTEEKKLLEIEKPILWEENEKKDKKEKDRVKKMENPLLKPGEVFEFDAEKYKEAVVTPWYRNQDQPQFFLVAEICWNLTPDSAFPSSQHASFRSYYKAKYGAELTQTDQPLLDVDHTSARLNLLTPRYVNRKGVALPVSSERTRRAKRDRLDQKQILVPELCRVHPFAAPLWFATVALPCVLYRINALLIADEIRRSVAIDVGLGIPRIDDDTCPGFEWPPLDFGWSLAEVLNADDKVEKKKDDDDTKKEERDRTKEEKGLKEIEDKKEVTEKTINDILQEKEDAVSGFEIGTWSNDMASSIPQEYDEMLEPLPSNLTFCTSSSGGANWSDPIEKPKSQFNANRAFSMADSDCSYMSSDFDTDDTDMSDNSDDDTDTSGFCSSKNSNAAMGVRIEYKTAHEAEAVDLERRKPVAPAPQPDGADDEHDLELYKNVLREGEAPEQYVNKFRISVENHEKEIKDNGLLIHKDEPIIDLLPDANKNAINDADNIFNHKKSIVNNQNETKITLPNNKIVNNGKLDVINDKIDDTVSNDTKINEINKNKQLLEEIFPYGKTIEFENGQITLESIEKNKRILLAELKKSLPDEQIKKMNCFSMKDIDIDSKDYVNEKIVNVGFDSKDKYKDKVNSWKDTNDYVPYYMEKNQNGKDFDFDYQPNLEGHPGPSPSVILQALTMSNANDGINLERLETIGDSFLKFAITAYLYCAHPAVHEGKLSHMRSKQVSNLNLYRLGRNKRLGARMIASKFEPHDNWLPPCHKPPPTLQPNSDDTKEKTQTTDAAVDNSGCFIPYNLITQHSIPDKSIADCVEALIGAYLLECGPRGALLFMSWLGIRVLPQHILPLTEDHPYVVKFEKGEKVVDKVKPRAQSKAKSPASSESSCSESEAEAEAEGARDRDWGWRRRAVGSLRPHRDRAGRWWQPIYGELKAPPSPLLRYIEDPEGELEQMLSGYDALERTLQYRFKDRSLLLQALTHASHQKNRLTDCYQRLEFLGDAILDYLITRHLYEDPRRHSPGALTDLRSALVNNTIFATLAARHGFHKYFRHMSPGLNEVLTKYVKIQEENGHSISEEHYLIQEDEMEQAEDVEVPKALGDLFESVTGAIFLDSGMSLAAVWRSVGALLSAELDAFSAAAPKSPVRELLEAEPDTAKFGKPERLADGRRVRVCVEVFGRGTFKGVGRNYRIAKGTAARCALRHLRDNKPR